jgi:hypothetical protein
MPQFFYLLIDFPALIAAPIVAFAALALWSRSRTAWVATAAWILYLVYELGMRAEVLCSGDECIKRTPLYIVYPLLALLSVVALVQVYVRIRDKRHRAAALSARAARSRRLRRSAVARNTPGTDDRGVRVSRR